MTLIRVQGKKLLRLIQNFQRLISRLIQNVNNLININAVYLNNMILFYNESENTHINMFENSLSK